jgi:lantibiotic transport system permease protein
MRLIGCMAVDLASRPTPPPFPSSMHAFFRATSAELLKIRRTRAFWLALAAPATVIALYVLLVLVGAIDLAVDGGLRSIQSMLVLWAMLMLPLYAALETALLNAIDHDGNGWTHIFALPIPRWAVHTSKLFVATLLVGMSSLVLAAGLLAAVTVLNALGPGVRDVSVLARLVGLGALASYGGAASIIAIHHGLSLRLRGFEWPLGIAIAGTLFATQASRSADYWPLLPWGYPVVAASAADANARGWAIALSIGLGAIVAILSAYDTRRRDIA